MPSLSMTDRIARWFDRHRFPVDAAGAALLVLGSLVLGLATGTAALTLSRPRNAVDDAGGMNFELVAVLVFTALIVAPLALRRRRPVLAVVLTYSAALLHLVLGIALIVPADLFVLAALYSVTVHGPRWAYRTAAAGAGVGTVVVSVMLVGTQGGRPQDVVLAIVVIGLMFLVTWAFGLVRRSRRSQITALHDRADRLERERDQQSLLAAAAERNRIAREMHDIVAHSLSVMIAQADGGRYASARDPEAATRVLGTIGETGRAALADMRRLLGVLRDGDATTTPGPVMNDPAVPANPAASAAAERAPQPDIDGLVGLVAQVRAAGVRVALGTTGTRRELPPGAALTVYRVCQEALTNVLKHAGPHVSVSVMLMWHTDRIVLQVSDDGRGAAAGSDGRGHGVLGMTERAAMFQGSVTTGPRPGGGYRVTLTVPIPGLRTTSTVEAAP